jgi:hypothetical protein
MSDKIKVFWCEPSGRVALWLRRYRSGAEKCAKGSYCNGMAPFGEAPAKIDARGYLLLPDGQPADQDPRWPVKCDACGEPFAATDPFQLFQDQIYRDAEGREWRKRDLPAGACYNAWYYGEDFKGPDGRSLVVVLPTADRHEWCIDSRASNCGLPNDNVHKCWVRHGTPEDGTLHVDKDGHTCSAGGGSIAVPSYHGFLHSGHLVSC